MTKIWLPLFSRLNLFPCHTSPASFHRCVSLNRFLQHWWGVQAGAGLLLKALYLLDLALLLNTMNLALCESGFGYCREYKYSNFECSEYLEIWRKSGLPILFPAHMSLSRNYPAFAILGFHCRLHGDLFDKLRKTVAYSVSNALLQWLPAFLSWNSRSGRLAVWSFSFYFLH